MRVALVLMLISSVLAAQVVGAGEAHWLVERSSPSGREIEVVSTSGGQPATWQVDWVNYVKIIGGPFATREEAASQCSEAAKNKGSYYRESHCD